MSVEHVSTSELADLRQRIVQLECQLAEQQERELRLQCALAASPVVVFYQDRDLRYTWAFNSHPSLPSETVVGKSDFDLFPRDSAERLTALKRQAQLSPIAIRAEVELEIAGEMQFYDLTLMPLTGQDGPQGGIIGVACDIGARRRMEDALRRSERRYRTELEQRVKVRTQELAWSGRQLQEQTGMLRSILDSMTDGVTVADTQGRFILFNRAGEQILGLGPTEALSADWPEQYGLFLPDGSAHFPSDRLPLVQALNGEVVRNMEVLVRRPGLQDVILSVNAAPLVDGNGKLLGGVAVYRDTTAARAFQQALAESEERFRQLAEGIHEVFWLGGVGDQSGTNLYVSPAYTTIFGRDVESLKVNPESWFEAIHPDDRQRVRQALANQAQALYDVEFRIIRPDGELRWIHDRAFPVRDAAGNICRVAGIAEDITQRKQFEQRLEANDILLRRLLDLQERERQLTASEIHDGFAQHVVGAHMRLEGALERIPDSAAEARQRLEAAALLMQQAIREARRMIVDLRPMILDERGIVSAIEHLVSDRRFSETLQIDFIHDTSPRLDPMLEGTLFRIVQEALNNVRAHSQSQRAEVRLTSAAGELLVEVQDWGIGFDPQQVAADRFGLQSIQQRARLFGGSAAILTHPGAGTLVQVRIPVEAKRGGIISDVVNRSSKPNAV